MADVLRLVVIGDQSHVDLGGHLRPCTVIANEHGWVVIDLEDRRNTSIGDTEKERGGCQINRYFFKNGDKGWLSITSGVWFKILSPNLFVCVLDDGRLRVNDHLLPGRDFVETIQIQTNPDRYGQLCQIIRPEWRVKFSTIEGVRNYVAKYRKYCPELYQLLC